MTREEALAYAISQKAGLESELHRTPCGYGNWAVYSTVLDFINAAISALKGPTREQVERMRGEWIPAESDFDDDDTLFDVDDWCDWQCSACHNEVCYDDPMDRRWLPKFCPNCGAPMTDEAVDMVMERLEEVQNDQ